MNLRSILTIYLKELMDSLRDRRTIISMIVVPTLVIPTLMFGVGTVMSKIMRQAKEEGSTIAIVGGTDSPGVVAKLKAAKQFHVVNPSGDFKQLISDKKIRAAVELPPGFEASLQSGGSAVVTIFHYEGELKSSIGVGDLEKFFNELRESAVEARLAARGLPATLVKPFDIKRQNVAAPEKVGGNALGGLIPYVIIILCFTGAMYPAMDLTAGEKERGTMETLLCSPVSRLNIVLGKFLMVLTASVTTMLLSLVSMGLSAALGVSYFAHGGSAPSAPGSGSVIPLIDPVGLIGVFAMILPVAVVFAAVLLAIALCAKSYKEAQSYVSPLLIVVIMPAVIGMLPGIELSVRTALVPILSLSLVCKEMLSGVWHWNFIALIFGSSCVYAAIALGFAVRMFNRESVLFRT
jgi:sodium transport system permease protein